MRDIKYKLTISVMASNRKDTLPKTLESIKPILENVSSELIVTDTGCDEELLEIIRGYTDKIVKFQWCNDFSKARNVSVELAQGQWYMFVDDDEWFEDVTSIINFFNSKESEKYNAFDYVQRNYSDYQGASWRDMPVGRATRLVDGQKFVDVIHEHFLYNLQPIKMMDAYVHHYGYIYKSVEEQMNHSKRNLQLLEKQMAEGNHHLRQYVHMLQEYNGLEQHEKAYEMALQGLQKAEENNEYIIKYVSGIKTNIVYSLLNMNKSEEVISRACQYMREGAINMSAYCAINGFLTHAYYGTDNTTGVIDTAKEYFGLLKQLKKNMIQMVHENVLTVGTAFSDVMPNMVFNMALMAAVQMQDEESALDIMKEVEVVDYLKSVDDGEWLQELVDMMLKSTEKTCYAKTIALYMNDLMCATKICNKLLDIKEQDEESFMMLAKNIVAIESDNPQIKLLRTIYYGLKGEVDKLRHDNL